MLLLGWAHAGDPFLRNFGVSDSTELAEVSVERKGLPEPCLATLHRRDFQ